MGNISNTNTNNTNRNTNTNRNRNNKEDGNIYDTRVCAGCGVPGKDTALFELKIPEITGIRDNEPYCRSCLSDILDRSRKVREVTKSKLGGR